jgi:hypothetical protein
MIYAAGLRTGRGEPTLTYFLLCAGWTGVSLVSALPIARRIRFQARLPEGSHGLTLAH